jgi:hypothetical protein
VVLELGQGVADIQPRLGGTGKLERQEGCGEAAVDGLQQLDGRT